MICLLIANYKQSESFVYVFSLRNSFLASTFNLLLVRRHEAWSSSPDLTELPDNFTTFISTYPSIIRLSKSLTYDRYGGEKNVTQSQEDRIKSLNYICKSTAKPKPCQDTAIIDLNVRLDRYKLPEELNGSQEVRDAWRHKLIEKINAHHIKVTDLDGLRTEVIRCV